MNNTVMKDTAKVENAFTSDETMRYKYMLREKAIRDYYSGLDDAKQEGIEIGEKRGRKMGIEIGEKRGEERGRKLGIEQGREQGERQAIMGMLRHHLEPECIAQILQCPIEKVETIAKEYQLESD